MQAAARWQAPAEAAERKIIKEKEHLRLIEKKKSDPGNNNGSVFDPPCSSISLLRFLIWVVLALVGMAFAANMSRALRVRRDENCVRRPGTGRVTTKRAFSICLKPFSARAQHAADEDMPATGLESPAVNTELGAATDASPAQKTTAESPAHALEDQLSANVTESPAVTAEQGTANAASSVQKAVMESPLLPPAPAVPDSVPSGSCASGSGASETDVDLPNAAMDSEGVDEDAGGVPCAGVPTPFQRRSKLMRTPRGPSSDDRPPVRLVLSASLLLGPRVALPFEPEPACHCTHWIGAARICASCSSCSSLCLTVPTCARRHLRASQQRRCH